MSLNYLLHRHQISLMRADAATGAEARLSHRALAAGYSLRIDELVGASRGTDMPLIQPF